MSFNRCKFCDGLGDGLGQRWVSDFDGIGHLVPCGLCTYFCQAPGDVDHPEGGGSSRATSEGARRANPPFP